MTWSAKLARWLSVADAGRGVDFHKSAFGAVEPECLEGAVGVLQVARLGIGQAEFCQDENGSVFIEREVRRQLASEPTPPEQVHPIPPTAGFLDRSALQGVLAHVEMLGLDPGRGPAGHTKTAGHPTPALPGLKCAAAQQPRTLVGRLYRLGADAATADA